MNTIEEYTGRYLKPSGTSRILNLPFGCFDSQKCAPYKVHLLPGQYRIELWGASGGDTTSRKTGKHVSGGRGGYVRGILKIENPLMIYVYVGAKGRASNTASYNGGGRGPVIETSNQGQGAGGGGATDVRLIPSSLTDVDDDEDDEISLNSRLMVAGAGGGACGYSTGARGGDNLGLTGESGKLVKTDDKPEGTPPTGGTIKNPGQGYRIPSDYGKNGEPGASGRGGGFRLGYDTGAGAGGGGFFGGGSGGWSDHVVASGAAGSSFVRGCLGCQNVGNLPNLSESVIIGGNELMPSPLDFIDGKEEDGHFGNGFARITVEMGGFELPESCRRKRDKTVRIASMMLIGLL